MNRKARPYGAVVAIESSECGDTHKAVRLMASKDGSFSIAVPYHPTRVGALIKLGAPPVLIQEGAGWSPPQEAYGVTRLVKLSYHASGFVQFSEAGEGSITSGRWDADGFWRPKGIGIQSHPITDPIHTGPAVGVSLFELHEHARLRSNERSRVILFREGDYFERDDHQPDLQHVYGVEIFVLPFDRRMEAIYVDGEWVLDTTYGSVRTDWNVRLRVFDLPSPLAFLGILVSRRHYDLRSAESPSAYSIGGPRDIGSGFWIAGMFGEHERKGGDETDTPAGPSLDRDPP